jgi:hypothetical protein
MRNTTAVIEFPFTFKYPRAGIYEEANAITVCEPAYEKRAVHRRMSSTVFNALTAWQRKVAEAGQMPNQAPPSEPSDGDKTDAAALITGDVIMIMLRAGMKTEDFVRFCDSTQRELTECKALAFVGTDLDDRQPLVEEVWAAIARAGGVEAIDRVIGEFARFFSGFGPSPTSNGTPSSSSSGAKPAGSSRTRKA